MNGLPQWPEAAQALQPKPSAPSASPRETPRGDFTRGDAENAEEIEP